MTAIEAAGFDPDRAATIAALARSVHAPPGGVVAIAGEKVVVCTAADLPDLVANTCEVWTILNLNEVGS